MYPTEDSEGRRGIYCNRCGAIFYVPPRNAEIVRERECPICGDILDTETTLRWIISDSLKWQPTGKGFKCHAPA